MIDRVNSRTAEWLIAATARVLDAQDASFEHLFRISGLDPSRDLRFTNLEGVDFAGSVLDGFDFTGANLSGCSFANCVISGAIFDADQLDIQALKDALDSSQVFPPTLTGRVAKHLEALRRYSHVIQRTGPLGDTFVAAMLEALIANMSIFPAASSDRVAMYKLYSIIFSQVNLETPDGLNIRPISPKAQAYFLWRVERFSIEEISEILSIAYMDIISLLETAASSLQADALVAISDERESLVLAEILERSGCKVLDVITEASAIRFAIDHLRPGLLVLDEKFSTSAEDYTDVPTIIISSSTVSQNSSDAITVYRPIYEENFRQEVTRAILLGSETTNHSLKR